jgi:uncharacterized membrane protein YphA (DoxX/SURF4 family)
VLAGFLFVVSGFEKLTQPYQNFLYVIQTYDFLDPALEVFAARSVPWAEFLGGAFLLVGLWTRPAGAVLLALNTGFLAVVGQALARKLPIQSCGCFGDLVSVPLPALIVFDALLWTVLAALVFRAREASAWGLDRRFAGDGR